MSIISSFPVLAHNFIHIAKQCAASVGIRSFMAINGLHEMILGAPPPGAVNQLLFPHDHSGKKFNGGFPIARNNIYSFATDNAAAWAIEIPANDLYYRVDRDGTTRAINQQQYPCNFQAYVSPGLDSDFVSYDSGNDCAVEAKLMIYVGSVPATTTTVRFFNRTTLTYSSGVPTSTIGSIVQLGFDDIPIAQGRWNQFDIEAKMTNSGAPYTPVYILDCVVSETIEFSEPESEGSSIYSSVTKP